MATSKISCAVRAILGLAFVLGLGEAAHAQYVQITGTVASQDGCLYMGGTGDAQLYPTNVNWTIQQGHPINQFIQVIVKLDSFAHFSIQLINTSVIDQQSSSPQYQFRFVNTAGQGFVVPPMPLTFSQDITTQISAAAPPAGGTCTGGGGGGTTHNLLSTTHSDTIPFSPPHRGDVITGQNLTSPSGVNPAWARLPLGTNKQCLTSNATDDVWSGCWWNVYLGGTLVGTEKGLNLIQGSNVTLTVVDNPGASRVDATIAATGGGGGGTSTVFVENLTPDTSGSVLWTVNPFTNFRDGYWLWSNLASFPISLYGKVRVPHVLPSGTAKVILSQLGANDNIAGHTMTFEVCTITVTTTLNVAAPTCTATQNFTTTTTAYGPMDLTFTVPTSVAIDTQIDIVVTATIASGLTAAVQMEGVSFQWQ